jgi:hypothetical protein
MRTRTVHGLLLAGLSCLLITGCTPNTQPLEQARDATLPPQVLDGLTDAAHSTCDLFHAYQTSVKVNGENLALFTDMLNQVKAEAMNDPVLGPVLKPLNDLNPNTPENRQRIVDLIDHACAF